MLLTSWLAPRPSRRRPRPSAPAATERLEDRPLLAGTPLSLPAAADGTVTDHGMDGTWDAVDATSPTVGAWVSSPSGMWPGREDRGAYEFGVSAAAGGVLESASLSVQVNGVSDNVFAGDRLLLSVYAYAGDGAVTAADATRTATKVGELAVDASGGVLGPRTITLDAAALRPLVAAGGHVGLLTVVTSPDRTRLGVSSSESSDAATRPELDLVVNRSAVTVDTLVDENDGNYAAGDLSLREAVSIVDAGGTVTFAAGLAGGTITLGGSQIVVGRNMTIAGLGASRLAVDGNGRSRVFYVAAAATAEIKGLTVTGGKEFDGGGVLNSGTLTLAGVSVVGNEAEWFGGGIQNSGVLTVSDSTVSGNAAARYGGGGVNSFGTLAVVNSTISGNAAPEGGGIWNTDGGTAVLRNATVVGNRLFPDRALFGGGISNRSGTLTLHNTLVAGNLGRGSAADDLRPTALADGMSSASSYNLIGDAATSGGLADGVNGNVVGVDWRTVVDPVLRDNGGPTETHALLPGSAAVDAGSDARAVAPDGTPLVFDQRGAGHARIRGGAVDVGAVEVQIGPPKHAVVDTLADEDDGDYSAGDLSLREAVAIAAAGGTITFAASLAGGTITLGGSHIVVDRNVTITGLGANQLTIDADGLSRAFYVSATVTITGLTITGGYVPVVVGSPFDGSGGAILNAGTLTLEDSAIVGNEASSGGGLSNMSVLTVRRTRIADNVSGGVGGGIRSFGSLNVVDCEVSGNTAAGWGGGISGTSGATRISGSTISGNSSNDAGGGVHQFSSGLLNIWNSTISGNAARANGGGVANAGVQLLMRNATVFGNRADSDGNGSGVGGGLWNTESQFDPAISTLYNSIFVGNFVGSGSVASDIGTAAGGLNPFPQTSGSHNLIGIATPGTNLSSSNGNLLGVDWTTVLEPVLRDNGGPTRTHALLVGSIAVNSGSNARALAADGTPLAFDQRGLGFPRVVGGTVDIGAFEAPNTAPVARPDAVSTGESLILVHSLFLDNGSGPDFDPDRNPLTVTAVNGSSADVGSVVTLSSGAKLVVNADGIFLFDPYGKFEHLTAGQTATYSFTYTVSDNYDGTATATATVTLVGANDPPVAGNDAIAAGEDASVSLSPLGNDSDPDAGHAIRLLSVDTTGLRGTVTLGPYGTLTYDPGLAFGHLAAGQTATETFTYTVADEHGATSTAAVTVTITGANDAPAAAGDAFRVDEDGILTAEPLDNDGDPDGNPLSVAAVNGIPVTADQTVTLQSGAKLRVNADGTLTYDPNGKFDAVKLGQTAADFFTYTVSDGSGGTAIATATVTIHGANDAPTVPTRASRTNEHRAAPGSLLAGAADAEGDTLSVAQVNGSPANVGGTITLPSRARLTVNPDGSYTYDPNGAFVRLRRGETATDSFTYTLSDGNGGTVTATETVTIEGGGSEADLIGYVGGEWHVAASDGSAFVAGVASTWANVAWDALKTGDFDGNGRTDVLGLLKGEWYVGLARTANSGLTYFSTSRWGKWNGLAAWEHVLVGDVDGDGKDDIVAEVGGVWYGAVSNGSSFLAPQKLAGTSDAAWGLAALADVTGDGKDDLVLVLNGDWYVGASTGSTFGTVVRWMRMGSGAYQLLTLADLNKDGKADAVGFIGGEWRTGTSDGTNAFATSLRAKWANTVWLDPVVGDFDGDGTADLAARYGGQRYVGLSNAAGGEASRSRWAAWNNLAWKDVTAGDFDGDGRADVAGRYNGEWYVARSTGSGFTTSRWGRWTETAWRAVTAGDADGSIPPVTAAPPSPAPTSVTTYSTSTSGSLKVTSTATAPFAARAEDEPVLRFWSTATRDEELAAGLLGTR